MKTLEASQLREGISDAMNTVAYTGERISIRRHGKPVAVLVSVEDAAMLEARTWPSVAATAILRLLRKNRTNGAARKTSA